MENWKKSFEKIVHKMRLEGIIVLMFAIFFGLGLTAGDEMFYNSVLMPVIGALGYVIFRWKAAYLVPILMFVTDFFIWLWSLIRGLEEIFLIDSLMWTLIYSFFVILGVGIAGLVHWGIRRGDKKQKAVRGIGLTAAGVLILGLGIFANALVGNPISRMLANYTAKNYLARQYAGTDYELTEVGFNFKNTDYYAKVSSPSSADTYFTLHIDMGGRLLRDSFESQVANGNNTASRLSKEYRALADTVLEAPDFPYSSEQNIYYGDLVIESVEWGSEFDPAHILMMEDLQLDGAYDVGQLGSNFGNLCLHIGDGNVTVERAAEILLEIKSLFDEKGIGVYCVDFMLRKPRSEDGSREEVVIWVEDFLWEDIYEEGLEERILMAHDKLQERLEEK